MGEALLYVLLDLKNKIPYLELLRLLLQDPVLIGILMWKFSQRKIQTIFHQKYPIQNCFFFLLLGFGIFSNTIKKYTTSDP